MCKDLQENKINKIKYHEEIDQFIEQFKGQIIGQHYQYLLNTKTMFMNRGRHDLKTTNYGEHFTNRRNQSISIYNKNVRNTKMNE